MGKLALCIAALALCLTSATAANAVTAYDGSWNLLFVTQRGVCDPTYNFTVKWHRLPSQPRAVQRLCPTVRCRSCVSNGSGQVCFWSGQALKHNRPRDLERAFGPSALRRSLDCAKELTGPIPDFCVAC